MSNKLSYVSNNKLCIAVTKMNCVWNHLTFHILLRSQSTSSRSPGAQTTIGMSLNLAEGSYRWLSEDECEDLDILHLPEDGSEGYILEVSMYCPNNLMNYHDLSFVFCVIHTWNQSRTWLGSLSFLMTNII